MKTLKVTTLEDLKRYSAGEIVQLPSFAEGQPFYARLKRPSLMNMVRKGKIPNSLLVKANELFVNKVGNDPEEEEMMIELFDVLELIASETLAEPTYKELKENGIELTDEQMMFLYTYGQQGVKALEGFRQEQKGGDHHNDGETIPMQAK